MTDLIKITILPINKVVKVPKGSSLHDLLFPLGVEFPCGGNARCKRCQIRLVEGELPPSNEDKLAFYAGDLVNGFRLACTSYPSSDITIEIRQWETLVLGDNTSISFKPRNEFGIAVDLGTTTVVCQLIDLLTGEIHGTKSGLNSQAKYGADIMSRLEFALKPKGSQKLKDLIIGQIGSYIEEISKEVKGKELKEIVIVGNTAMQHLFFGFDVTSLSYSPYIPHTLSFVEMPAKEIGWNLPGRVLVRFLPNLGGFIGSDALGVILTTKMYESPQIIAACDLGTNGEIILGNKDKILVASTAAGPAFEGVKIEKGMRAGNGAISHVDCLEGSFKYEVIGNKSPVGICGSGLVDAIACFLESGYIDKKGKIVKGNGSIMLESPVYISQNDIRELQLAKAAISSGFKILMEKWGCSEKDVLKIYLAGAFGNYLTAKSANAVGLLPFSPDKIVPIGNAALAGAKVFLFRSITKGIDQILSTIEHVPLASAPSFETTFVDEIYFK